MDGEVESDFTQSTEEESLLPEFVANATRFVWSRVTRGMPRVDFFYIGSSPERTLRLTQQPTLKKHCELKKSENRAHGLGK